MKSFEPNTVGVFAEHCANALAHIGRSLVGKGDGENLRGPNFLVGQEVSDATSEHGSLTRTGTGD